MSGWIMEQGMMDGNSSNLTLSDSLLFDKYADSDTIFTGEPLQVSITALYTGCATGPVFWIKSWYDLGKVSGRIMKAYITWKSIQPMKYD